MSEVFEENLAAAFATAQPWRMPDFGQGGRAQPPRNTAQALDEIEAAAHEEGLARGHAEGYAAGLAEARKVGAQLQSLLSHLAQPLAELDAGVERTLVALTIEVARRLAHLEMDLDPTRVAQVVRESVEVLGNAPRDVRVYLHPDDLAAVRGALSSQEDTTAWKLLADRELNRGDCRIVADGARVDARLDTRQAELAQQLLGEET